MAGAFESFVQTELPLRPFTPVDGNQEAIAIRRGIGPRQMTFLDLQDGQVLARVDGVLKGVSVNNIGQGDTPVGGVRHFVADVAEGSEQSTWNLAHNMNSRNLVYTVYMLVGGALQAIIPDSVKIVDANNVEFKFASAIAGKVVLSFVD